jgi:small subunit ribosomal protein S14
MAKKSKIAKNKQRLVKVQRFAKVRAELKEIISSMESSDEERMEAYRKLRALPRDSSPTRLRNRCFLTGRPRGVYSRFGLGRIALRERALRGELPGVTKASW